MLMSNNLSEELYRQIVCKFRCPAGKVVPGDVLNMAIEMRQISRDPKKVHIITMRDLERLIDCLNALQEYFSELEYILITTIHNILLQNRALLIQIAGEEGMFYFNMLFDHISESWKYLLHKNMNRKPLPKYIFQVTPYSEMSKIDCKIVKNEREQLTTIAKVKLGFVLLSQPIPATYVDTFLKRNFAQWTLMVCIFKRGAIEEILTSEFDDSNHIRNTSSFLTEVYQFWYAFVCKYEDRVRELAVCEGWIDRYYDRWMNFFDVANSFCQCALQSYSNGTFLNQERNKVKCLLSMMNVLLLPKWEVYQMWLEIKGIDLLYPLHMLGFKLIEDNLSKLNHNELYSKADKSFNFVNKELLPLLCLQNHMIDISDRYDVETARCETNFTRAIFKYAYGGKFYRKNGTPETLGLPQHLIDTVPDLRPLVDEILQEPLLIKMNKEILGIFRKLDINKTSDKHTPQFVNLRAADPNWNLLAVNVVNSGAYKYRIADDDMEIKLEEANNILNQLTKLS